MTGATNAKRIINPPTSVNIAKPPSFLESMMKIKSQVNLSDLSSFRQKPAHRAFKDQKGLIYEQAGESKMKKPVTE